jgi:hypothetical protein
MLPAPIARAPEFDVPASAPIETAGVASAAFGVEARAIGNVVRVGGRHAAIKRPCRGQLGNTKQQTR